MYEIFLVVITTLICGRELRKLMPMVTQQKLLLILLGIRTRDGLTENGRGANPTFNINDWNIEKEEYSTIGQSAENGNDIVVNSYPIFKFSNPQQYIGVNNDTLTIAKIPLTFDDLNFRVVVSTPAFKCDTVVISSCSNVKVEAMEDTDGDGVPDYVGPRF